MGSLSSFSRTTDCSSVILVEALVGIEFPDFLSGTVSVAASISHVVSWSSIAINRLIPW